MAIFLAPVLAAAPGVATFAGNGQAGLSGDGGDARSASLNLPSGLAKDSLGNIYIADSGNNVVRMVNPAGVISTVVGTGVAGNAGDGGPATAAKLSWPMGLWVDASDRLYIADYGNNVVRMVSAGNITTLSGTLVPFSVFCYPFAGPMRITGDNAGSLWISYYGANVLGKLNSGTMTMEAGTCSTYQYNIHPSGIALDGAGNTLYLQAAQSRLVRMTGGVAADVTLGAGVWGPLGLAFDGPNFWIADTDDQRILEFDAGGNLLASVGSGAEAFQDGPAATAEFREPADVLPLGGGQVLVADMHNHRVRLVLDSAQAALIPTPPAPSPTTTPSSCDIDVFDGLPGSRDDAWNQTYWTGVGETSDVQGYVTGIHMDNGFQVIMSLGPTPVALDNAYALEFDFNENVSLMPSGVTKPVTVSLGGPAVIPYTYIPLHAHTGHVAIPLADLGNPSSASTLVFSQGFSAFSGGGMSILIRNVKIDNYCAWTTRTPTPSNTFTISPTISPTLTLSQTLTTSPSLTPTPTNSPYLSPTPTLTLSATPTDSPNYSPTPSLTVTATPTPSPYHSPTLTHTHSPTPLPALTGTMPAGSSYAYPQPAAGSVNIAIQLSQPAGAEVQILSGSGGVASVLNSNLGAGLGSLQLNLAGYAPGIYYYRVVLHNADGSTDSLPVKTFMVVP